MAHKQLSKLEQHVLGQLSQEVAQIEGERKYYQHHLDQIAVRVAEAKKRALAKATADFRELDIIGPDEEVTDISFEDGKCVGIHHEKVKPPEPEKKADELVKDK